jgi:hypothetical protein
VAVLEPASLAAVIKKNIRAALEKMVAGSLGEPLE